MMASWKWWQGATHSRISHRQEKDNSFTNVTIT